MNSKCKLKDFSINSDIEQIIIPEIQRDYVWGKENIEKLLNTIHENCVKQTKNTQGITDDTLSTLSPEIREALVRTLEEKAQFCNIGFIYAYTDPEIADRRILIDGQQRITTLFLLLLFLSIKEGKQDRFKNLYFKNQMLKLDYKVRESAHEFMLHFVDFLLNNNDAEYVKNQYWYFSEYNSDITIQHLIDNYIAIKNYCKGNELSLEFSENHTEFWRFDIDKSAQGEELYIYMNSRGESVSPSESIKAELLKDLPDDKKDLWGEKWEGWQNFFWQNRGNNPNADIGIACFLRMISIIETIKMNDKESVDKLAGEIKIIKEQKKTAGFNHQFENIESYFNAYKALSLTKEIHWNDEWLRKEVDALQYFILFPAILYVMKYEQFQQIDLKRFTHFFSNLTKFENLAKNPYNALTNIIKITSAFLDAGYTDIADIISFKEKFKTILTDEETLKLSIHKSKNNAERIAIERSFWKAEEFYLCNGTVDFLFDCIDYDKKPESFDNEKLQIFNEYLENFIMLFEKTDDILRRTLLTKGDYKVWNGFSTALLLDRYSFLSNMSEWQNNFMYINSSVRRISRELLLDYSKIKNKSLKLSRIDTLNKIIEQFLEDNQDNTNWIYLFVKNPSVLSYCTEKKVCFGNSYVDSIVLLSTTKAYRYKKLKDML